MMRRRKFLQIAASALVLAGFPVSATSKPPSASPRERLLASLRELERMSGGRLGVAILDTTSGKTLEWRAGECFPICSTFKLLLVSAVLQSTEQGRLRLDQTVRVRASDIVEYAPVTEPMVGKDASVRQLCEAAITRSDNTAANLLLMFVGGPKSLTRFARSIGDPHTRLDRTETTLNSAIAGDPRDTTTPRDMARNLQRLLLGTTLSADSRALLLDWLERNQTGDARLRPGFPKDWRVGDKTGSGAHGTTNDIAIVTPPGSAPLLIASYLTGSKLDADGRNAMHAGVARAIVSWRNA